MPAYVTREWRKNLFGDISAGLTVGAFLVPQGMSYALIGESFYSFKKAGDQPRNQIQLK
jgi:hypothetical protein